MAMNCAAYEKSMYNVGTNDEIVCASFYLPSHESRGLMKITLGQDGGLRR
jgi:hypothetical protein